MIGRTRCRQRYAGPLPFRKCGSRHHLQIQEAGKCIRLGDPEVIARQNPDPASPRQHVSKMGEQPIHSTFECETDDEVGPIRVGEMRDEVRQQRLVASGREALGRRWRAVDQVIGPARNYMSNAAAGIGDVAYVAGDDVHMEMADGLAGRRTNVYAYVESIRPAPIGDRFSCGVYSVGERPPLFDRRIEPVGDVPTCDQ